MYALARGWRFIGSLMDDADVDIARCVNRTIDHRERAQRRAPANASIVDSGGKGDLPSEDWATLANCQGLRIEMLQKEVADAISNIKVHKDNKPTDAVLPPAEQESNLRNRLNIHLTEVG